MEVLHLEISEKRWHVTRENIKEHSPNWPQIPNHVSRILIIRGSTSEKTNALLNLIIHQSDIDKVLFS